MNGIKWLLVVATMATAIDAGPLPYDEAEAHLRAKQQAASRPSEDEVRRLREENQSLRAQLTAAMEELNRLRAKLRGDAPAPAAPQGGRVTPGHLPASGRFFSTDEIVAVIPTAMRPKAGGDWLPLHVEQVDQWVGKNLEGKSFDGEMYVFEAPHSDGGVIVPCASNLPGSDVKQLVTGNVHAPASQTRALQDVKEGDRVHVVGVIRGAGAKLMENGGIGIAFDVTNATVRPAK